MPNFAEHETAIFIPAVALKTPAALAGAVAGEIVEVEQPAGLTMWLRINRITIIPEIVALPLLNEPV